MESRWGVWGEDGRRGVKIGDSGSGWEMQGWDGEHGVRMEDAGSRIVDVRSGRRTPPWPGVRQYTKVACPAHLPHCKPWDRQERGAGREHPGTPAVGPVRPRLAGFVPGRTMTCIKLPRLRSGAPSSPAARPGVGRGGGGGGAATGTPE